MSNEVRRARVATTLVFLLNGALLGMWATEVAPLRERLALSAAVLGGVLLCGAAGALLAMPLSARLIPRLGTRAGVPEWESNTLNPRPPFPLPCILLFLSPLPPLIFNVFWAWGGGG